MTAVCFRIDPADTVATLLTDAEAGPISLRGGSEIGSVTLLEPIELGHKVALVDIDEGGRIVKYGVTIGSASRPIRRGEWVHLHNCRSAFDERSSGLDLHTGAATEIRYE